MVIVFECPARMVSVQKMSCPPTNTVGEPWYKTTIVSRAAESIWRLRVKELPQLVCKTSDIPQCHINEQAGWMTVPTLFMFPHHLLQELCLFPYAAQQTLALWSQSEREVQFTDCHGTETQGWTSGHGHKQRKTFGGTTEQLLRRDKMFGKKTKGLIRVGWRRTKQHGKRRTSLQSVV